MITAFFTKMFEGIKMLTFGFLDSIVYVITKVKAFIDHVF